MATKITNVNNQISSGITFSENDLTVVQQQAAGFSAAAIVLTEKGPAFEITKTATFPERKLRLGDLNPKYLSSYYARQFLEQSNNYKEVRLLGLEGYSNDNGYVISYAAPADTKNNYPANSGKVEIAAYVQPGSVYAILKSRNLVDLGFNPAISIASVFIENNANDSSFQLTINYISSNDVPAPASQKITLSLRPSSKDYIVKKMWDVPFKLDANENIIFPTINGKIFPLWVDFIVPSTVSRPNLSLDLGYYLPGTKTIAPNSLIPLTQGDITFAASELEFTKTLTIYTETDILPSDPSASSHLDELHQMKGATYTPSSFDLQDGGTGYYDYTLTDSAMQQINSNPFSQQNIFSGDEKTPLAFNYIIKSTDNNSTAFLDKNSFVEGADVSLLFALSLDNTDPGPFGSETRSGTVTGSGYTLTGTNGLGSTNLKGMYVRGNHIRPGSKVVGALGDTVTLDLSLLSSFDSSETVYFSVYPYFQNYFNSTKLKIKNLATTTINNFTNVLQPRIIETIYHKDTEGVDTNTTNDNGDELFRFTDFYETFWNGVSQGTTNLDPYVDTTATSLPTPDDVTTVYPETTTVIKYSFNLAYENDLGNLVSVAPIDLGIDSETVANFKNISVNINSSQGGQNYFTIPQNAGTLYFYTPIASSIEKTFDTHWKNQTTQLNTQYQTPLTPWFVSDFNSDGDYKRLFKFQSISDGNSANFEIKIEIANINPLGNQENGTFDVNIRLFNDTEDTQKQLVESFTNCTMDKTSSNYILRKIGNGEDFPNQSKWIVLVLNTEQEFDGNELPYGVEGYNTLYSNELLNINFTTEYDLSRSIANQTLGLANNSINANGQLPSSQLSYFKPNSGETIKGKGFHLNPENIILNNINKEFNLVNQSIYQKSNIDTNRATPVQIKQRSKFVVAFQGGFDGWNVYKQRTFGVYNSPDYNSLLLAVNLLSDNETLQSDFSVLVTPDFYLDTDSAANELVLQMCENRGDCLYIPDFMYDLISLPQTFADAINASNLLSSYAAVYTPWLQIEDTINQINVWNPASILALGTIAYVAQNQNVWQPPGGSIKTVTNHLVQSRRRMTLPDREILKAANINPITYFAGSGYEITEVRTTQPVFSALSFIHNRLLLGYAKKALNQVLRPLLLQLNGAIGADAFKTAVEPIFNRIKKLNGLEQYQITVNDSTGGTDVTKLSGTITMVPLYPIEQIEVQFDLVNNSFTFNQ